MGREVAKWLVAGPALYVALASCSLIVDTDNLTGEVTAEAGAADAKDSSSPDSSSQDSSLGPLDAAGADAGACAVKGGPMVRIVSAIGSAYCIDSTEVTQSQYSAFLTGTRESVSDPPPECRSNTDLVPCAGAGYEPATRGNYPVTCIDWCDAWSFCHWAGKRLCGAIAGVPAC